MKTFTYAAAIALLSAGVAFAQPSGSNHSSMMNNSTPTPTMNGPAEGNGGASSQSSSTMNNQMPSSSSMKNDKDQASSSMDHAGMKQSADRTKSKHVASRMNDRSQNARENQITEQLNQQQLTSGGMGGMRTRGMGAGGNSFNNGSPQQAQAGGANCTPDRPDCGTARQNPAIQSSPQQRTYNASPQ